MSKFKINKDKVDAVLRRIFYVAWNNCGGTSGMGWLQDAPDATEEQVWENVTSRGDYPGANIMRKPAVGINEKTMKGEASADYVFGRMMKLHVDFDINEGTITVRDDQPRPDYQGWARGKIKTYDDLVFTALVELNVNFEIEMTRTV